MFKVDQKELIKNNYYYHNTKGDDPITASGESTTDVCIIGAGFAGLSSALELAKLGYSVTVLEAKTVGFGASGRNGGKALGGWGCDISVFEKYCSKEDAKQAWGIAVEGVNLIKDRSKEYGIDCDWRDGYMIVATSPKKAIALRESYDDTLANYDWPDTKWFDASQMKDYINSPHYYGGYYDPNGGHFHPVKYLYGLARAAKQLGVKIYENSEVLAVDRGDINTIKTKDATIKAKYVVVAANVYIGNLFPELAKRIMPVGAWMVCSEVLGEDVAKNLIPARAAVYDSNNVLDYFRFTGDNRLLFGGGVSYSSLFPTDLKKHLRSHIAKVFPTLADVNLEFAWGGHVDISRHRNPDFGKLGDNIYYLQGFSGHGVAQANIAGKIIAETISLQTKRMDIFTKLPHVSFPGVGDYSRTMMLTLGMLYYRLRDIIG